MPANTLEANTRNQYRESCFVIGHTLSEPLEERDSLDGLSPWRHSLVELTTLNLGLLGRQPKHFEVFPSLLQS